MPLKALNYERRQKLSQFLGAEGAAHVLKHWSNLEAVFGGSVSKIIVMVMDGKMETDLNGEGNDDPKVSEARTA